MRNSSPGKQAPPRSVDVRSVGGFTLVEMLVVLAIIGVLTSLSVPAALQMRAAARKTQCATRMGQVVLAINQFEVSRKRMPGYLESMGHFAGGADPGDPTSLGGDIPSHEKLASWQAVILGHLDNQPVYERWSMDRYPLQAGPGAMFSPAPGGYAAFCAANDPNFICPSATLNTGTGSNHMVANTGLHPALPMITYTREGFPPVQINFARSQTRANGVFRNRYGGFLTKSSAQPVPVGKDFDSSDFRDGRTHTILISENLNAKPWYRVSFRSSAFLSDTIDLNGRPTVRYPIESRYFSGIVWHFVDPQNIVDAPSVPRAIRINGGDALNQEMSPALLAPLARPSSNHNAGVNFGFADGSVSYVTDSLDYRIFQTWMTPQTGRSDMPLNELIVTSPL